jgi:hypothetical protein
MAISRNLRNCARELESFSGGSVWKHLVQVVPGAAPEDALEY